MDGMNATEATGNEEDNRQRGTVTRDVALSKQARKSTQKAEISWKNSEGHFDGP